MGGTYYGWDQMYLQAVRCQLNKSKASGVGFCFGSFMCAFFFEKVPTLRPHWYMGAADVQVVPDDDTRGWWQSGPLLY